MQLYRPVGLRELELIAASGGNHGAAVAYVAARLGVAAEIVIPSTSPSLKRRTFPACRGRLQGRSIAARFTSAPIARR